MAKSDKKSVIVVLPRGTAAYAHLDVPDSKVPDGAAWKADNKYKVTIVYDTIDDLDAADKVVRDAASEKWGNVDFDEFQFPWKEHDGEAKREGFRNKVTVTTKSQHKPKIVDAKRNDVPASVKVFGGDIIKAAASVYLYEKTEKVKEGKKMVDVTIRGAALQLFKVQLLEKRAAGSGGADPFDDEDGYEAADAPATDSNDGDF